LGWSYNASLLAQSPRFQVRRMIGDVLSEQPQLQDEEIDFLLSTQPGGDVYLAAAQGCRDLAAQYSRKASTTVGPVHTTYDNQARAYAQRAIDIVNARRERLDIEGVPATGPDSGDSASAPNPMCGGVRGPQFAVGMFDIGGSGWPSIGVSRGWNE
jgi:hypothetical protein